MKVSRVLIFSLVAIAFLAVSTPSYAVCYKCYQTGECYGSEGRAERCISYGTACMTTGYCATGGECTEDCWYEQGALTPQPLATEYQLAEVKIEHFKEAAANVAVGKVPPTSLLR